VDEIKKIVNDLGNRDIINIQFIPFNKEQEQVERALKLIQLDLVTHIIHWSIALAAKKTETALK
jgi:hypothetical protein